MISYPLVLNKLQLCILNNQSITRLRVPSALTSYSHQHSCLHGLGQTTSFQRVKSSIHPSGRAKFFLNPGSSEERLQQTEKRRHLGHCSNSVAPHDEGKPTAWPWHWNHYWEEVPLSSQDLGSAWVTQTARDSQRQSETVRTRQAMDKDTDKIINSGRAHQVSLHCCHPAGNC